jgi:hypothetical protein
MNRAQRLAQRIDDAVNPIVIKELRQAIGGRFLPAILMLFLLVQLFAIGIAMWAYRIDNEMVAGRGVFIGLIGVLMGTCLLFLPSYAGLRLSAERSETNVDLLYITTIRPRSIVWGKFLAAMVLALLLFSACTPFLSLTYLLRGIDLPTIFLLMGMNFLTVAGGVMFAIFVACIPAKRGTKFILGLATLGVMGSMLWSAVGSSWVIAYQGFGIMMIGTWQFWAMFASSLVLLVLSMGLTMVLSVAMISPPSSNRALYVRAYLIMAWIVTTAMAFGWSWYESTFAPVCLWMSGWLGILGVALLAAISEREEWGPRVRRAIPRQPLLRVPAFVLFSGAAGGVAWTLLMGGATFGLALLWLRWGHARSYTQEPAMLYLLDGGGALTLYMIAYLLTALFLRRTVLSWLIIPVNTYALALILMAAGSIIPFMVALMATNARIERANPWVSITVPFYALENSNNTRQWWFAGIWAAAIGLLTVPWILMKWAEFCGSPPSAMTAALPGETPAPREESQAVAN